MLNLLLATFGQSQNNTFSLADGFLELPSLERVLENFNKCKYPLIYIFLLE